jgi:hypothetical protein
VLEKLLEALRGGIVADEVLEDCQDVLAILHDPLEQRAKLRLADGFFVPLGKDSGGDLNVLPKLVGRMAAEEKAVEKRGFALRELEFLQSVFQRVGHSCHGRNRSLQIWLHASRVQAAKREIHAALRATPLLRGADGIPATGIFGPRTLDVGS